MNNQFFYSFINKKKVFIIAIALLSLNLYLKLMHLTAQSIAGDEPFSIYFAQFDVWTIINQLSNGNNPPLFEIILHYWIKIFGIGSYSVRLLPCVFSCLTVLVIFKLCNKFFNFHSAVVTSLLFTFSNYHLYYSHEVRVYSLFLLLTCISMYSFLSLIKKHNGNKHFIILVSSNLLLIYAHYFGFFVIFVQLFSVIAFQDLRLSILKRYVKGLSIVIILYLPFIWIFLKRFYISAAEGTWISPVTNLGQLHGVLIFLTNTSFTSYLIFLLVIWMLLQKFVFESINAPFLRYLIIAISIFFLFYAISIMGSMPYYWKFTSNPLAMLSYLLFIIGMLSLGLISKRNNLNYKIILIWFLFPMLIMFIASIWIPMFINKYLIFITPGFYLLIGISVVNYESKNWIISLLLIAIMAITINTNMSNNRDVKQLIRKYNDIKTEKSIVFIYPSDFDITFTYYYNKIFFVDINKDNVKGNIRQNLNSKNIFLIDNPNDINLSRINEADKVIYINANATPNLINDEIFNLLSKSSINHQEYSIPEIFKIYEFTSIKE